MKIELFALCDAATESGKLNILGIFDTINTKTPPPVIHPQCAIVVRLRIFPADNGDHKISVQLTEKDGKTVVPPLEVNSKFYLPGDTGAANFIFNIQGLKLEHLGEHSINLLIDEKQIAALPFYVKQIPVPPPHN